MFIYIYIIYIDLYNIIMYMLYIYCHYLKICIYPRIIYNMHVYIYNMQTLISPEIQIFGVISLNNYISLHKKI